MKKSVIFTLIYAILFSMTAASFSLYTTSVPIASTVIGTKVFDVSQATAASVYDTQNLENKPTWMFMAFNSSAANAYDTNISITLNTPADGIRVGVFADTAPATELAAATFSGQTAAMVITKQFSKDILSRISMTLKYTYLGNPVSTSNMPAGVGSVLQGTVTVGGTVNNTVSDAEIIANILNNPWCYLDITANKNKDTSAYSYLSIGPSTSAAKAINETGSMRIYMTKSGSVYTFKTDYISPYSSIPVNIQTQTMTLTTFNPPDALVLKFANFTAYQTMTISNVKLSQTSSGTGPYVGNTADQTILLKNLPVNADGCFDVSFDFELYGKFNNGTTNKPEFSINFGFQ